MNNNNFGNCPICKNIFLKTHLKIHYLNCKKNNNEKYEKYEKYEKLNNKQIVQYNVSNNKNKSNGYASNGYASNGSSNSLQRNDRYSNNIQGNVIKSNQESKYFSNELRVETYISPQIVSYNDNMLNHFFSNYDKLFAKYIEGKCIAIVGPAHSILNSGKGEIIDKFDLVVGNPPYHDGSGNKGKGHTLWTRFIEVALNKFIKEKCLFFDLNALIIRSLALIAAFLGLFFLTLFSGSSDSSDSSES
jgi:hypothetical protein